MSKPQSIRLQNIPSEHTAIRMLPSDSELPALIATLQDQLQHAETLLAPYRANNTAPPTDEEVALIEENWTRWRDEWKKRKIMFKGLVDAPGWLYLNALPFALGALAVSKNPLSTFE